MRKFPKPSWHGADPDAPDFRTHLHERYAHLRAVAPVNLTPRAGLWRLSRHVDCQRLLKSPKVGVRSTEGTLVDEASAVGGAFMLSQDPPEHSRLRRLVAAYFTPRAMAQLTERVTARADELVERIGGGESDLVQALARPLPTAVICEIMGVAQEEQRAFSETANDISYILLGSHATPAQQERVQAALAKLIAYIQRTVEQRKVQPSADLIGVLVRAQQDGEVLSETELFSQAIGLILAGFETTAGLIAGGVRQLLRHPEQWQRLVDEPALVDRAVEECLRYEPPAITTMPRYLHEPLEFGGYLLPVNTRVMALVAAANRDPEVFQHAEQFDIGREENPHLSFGGGIHTCLGMHLARLEARAALLSLTRKLPQLRLVDDAIEWAPHIARIPNALRVAV